MVIAKVSTLEMDRTEWLKQRQAGLGGSDASVVLGFNKWKSPFQLYLEKTGEHVEEINNEFIYWGNVLEDIVAKEFEVRTGKKVRRLNKLLQHKDHPFMLANLDRVVVGEKAILECKTTSQYNKEAWEGDDIPAAYICQVQHYLAVTGYGKAYIAVLIGGNSFVWKEIERDEEFIEILIQREQAFWENHVIADVPPAIDGSPSASELLQKLYPQDDGSAIMLDEQSHVLIEAIEKLKADKKSTDELLKTYENQLKMSLEEASEGHSERFKVTYKAQTANRLDTTRLKTEMPDVYEKFIKTSTSRVLRIKQLEAN